ncbi:MAG: hypothetical protein K8R91_02420 [Phycisphaerae bacterium]|nr:hypothetical protein [Phycisphaerae bacterium]
MLAGVRVCPDFPASVHLTGQAGGPAFIVVKGILNIERRILNYEVTERKKTLNPRFGFHLSSFSSFHFKIQNSPFNIHHSKKVNLPQ